MVSSDCGVIYCCPLQCGAQCHQKIEDYLPAFQLRLISDSVLLWLSDITASNTILNKLEDNIHPYRAASLYERF